MNDVAVVIELRNDNLERDAVPLSVFAHAIGEKGFGSLTISRRPKPICFEGMPSDRRK
jgi:hypothetical protein